MLDKSETERKRSQNKTHISVTCLGVSLPTAEKCLFNFGSVIKGCCARYNLCPGMSLLGSGHQTQLRYVCSFLEGPVCNKALVCHCQTSFFTKYWCKMEASKEPESLIALCKIMLYMYRYMGTGPKVQKQITFDVLWVYSFSSCIYGPYVKLLSILE